MNKAQKVVVGFFFIALAVIATLFFISNNITGNVVNLPADDSAIILYYSFTCPHCKIVEDFIKENDIESKLNITQKEVSMNEENAKELIAIGNYYKLQAGYIGAVPLLYANQKYYLGDVDIINFLKEQTGVK